MKKLIMGVAAIAASVAMADGIVSSSVVGYQTITIKPGLNLIGTSFLKVDSNGRPNLNETFTDAQGKAMAGTGDDVADFIQVFDNATKGYPNEFYFYADPDYPSVEDDYKWCSNKDDETTDFVIPSANAFWYKSRGTETFVLTTTGAVGAENVEFTVKPGLNLIVNPFPCDLKLNSTAVNWKEAGAVSGTGDDVADFIQVFDSTSKGYPNEFYFYADPDYPSVEDDYKWCSNKDDETTEFAIPAGGGFWYKYRGKTDMKLTFTSPLASK